MTQPLEREGILDEPSQVTGEGNGIVDFKITFGFLKYFYCCPNFTKFSLFTTSAFEITID